MDQIKRKQDWTLNHHVFESISPLNHFAQVNASNNLFTERPAHKTEDFAMLWFSHGFSKAVTLVFSMRSKSSKSNVSFP